MDYEAIRVFVEIAQFVITGAIGIYVYLVNRGDAINKRVSSVERENNKRLDDHQGRIVRLEAIMPLMPTHNEMKHLGEDVASLKAETAGQTDLLKELQQQVRRINDWLIDRAQ